MGRQEIDREKADVRDDPELLSPPAIVEPLYRCATAVQVLGGVNEAKVEIDVNGAVAGSAQVGAVLPYGISVPVPALATGDVVRARQTTSTAQSGWSAPVTVRDHTEDYPAGPPRPGVFPLPLYRCGVRTGVDNLLPGGNVWVTADGAEVGRVQGCGNPQGVNVAPPFASGQQVRAWFELCGDPSPPSAEHLVGSPPSPLPAPIVEPLTAGGTQVVVSNVVNGAKVTVKRGGGVIGTWGCWGGSLNVGGLWPPLADSEVIEAYQEMCPGDPPSGGGTTVVQPCSSLPAPQVGPLQSGDTQVVVTGCAPGAVIRVWVNGTPVGAGAAPVVLLSTPVHYGDVVIVAQDLPGCRGQRALQISVPCVDAPVTGDPSAVDLFPVGTIDVAAGPNSGRVYYPAEDDGKEMPFAPRLAALGRVPLVVLAHGNHDPNVPNYLGYEFFQQALARMGFVTISVDCNSQNGMGYSTLIIERRADLIIGAIALLQTLDADPGSVLFGKVDFTRTGLMGHSQGGEAVVLVPEVITLPGVEIRAVLALAPTEGGATSRTPRGRPFMTILPASDGDVWPNDGAIFYDRAEPSPFKSQLFVHFTNHQFYNRQWLDDDSLWPNAAPTPPVLPRYDHERILTAYGSAFFRAALLQHPTTAYLAGYLLPQNVAAQHVQLSFEQKGVLTVDNHEDGNGIGKNSLNQPTAQAGGLAANEFAFHQGAGAFNSSFFGDSTGMVAPAGGTGRIFTQELGAPHDVRGKEIWIRVAEVFERRNDRAPTTGFRFGLRDAAGTEGWVDSDDVGGIPRPFPRRTFTMKTMLKTLRFHAGCFAVVGKLDLSTVTAVMLHCNRADERALAFDDLQIVPE